MGSTSVKKSRLRKLSLLEMVVTLALIGVVASFLGTSGYRAYVDSQIKAQTALVKNKLEFAAAMAVATDKPVLIQVEGTTLLLDCKMPKPFTHLKLKYVDSIEWDGETPLEFAKRGPVGQLTIRFKDGTLETIPLPLNPNPVDDHAYPEALAPLT